MKLLLIDDSLYVLKVIVKALKNHFPEAEIETASNGNDGLACYQTFKPDYLITDLLMPELSGQEVIKRIRENDKTTKIIVISADVQISTKLEISEYDVLQFINKPINEEKAKQLIDMIKEDFIA